ncbi:MAG: MmgE/PrpD family protein [Saprospiraceae bacterium]
MQIEYATQIQRVSRWVDQLNYDDIPADVVELAQLQLLDSIAAICAGARSTVGVRLRKALEHSGANGQSNVLPWGEHWSMENAVYYHTAMINALELDSFTFMGHVGQSAVAAPLSIAEILDKDGKAFLLAMIAAEEVAGRLSAYLTTGPQQGHMRAFIHRTAAAVATAKLYEMDETATARAIAIALSMPEFPLYPASFSPDTKIICTSSPTIEGIRAAWLAREGMDGPLDIIEHPLGFITYFSYLKYMPDIWAHIGESWVLYALSFKKYASCGYAQGPVNAALRIQEQGIDPTDICQVDIHGPIVTVVMEKFSKPHYGAHFTPVNTHFSTRRSVAAALLFGSLGGDFFAEGNFESKINAIEHLYNKTNLFHDWQMTINLIRGVDEGIEGAGKQGVLSLGGAGKAMSRFKKAFGSRPLLHLGDIPALFRLSAADRNYFFRRYWRSVHFSERLPFMQTKSPYSHEGDLSKMSFPLSGRVKVTLKDGQVLKASCHIPPGFAGDPLRKNAVLEKYFRETIPVWGEEKASRVKALVDRLPEISIRALMKACS